MIGLELSLKTDDSHRSEFGQSLEDLSREQTSSGTCIECRTYQDLRRPNEFLWLVWWRSERELREHLASVEFRTLAGVVKVLGSLVTTRVVGLQDSTAIMGAFITDRFTGANLESNT